MTKGSAPNSSLNFDAATNRIIGYSYDANGNMLSAANVSGLGYDVDNRLVSAGGDSYAYAPDNKRLWKKKPDGSEEWSFYGISGQKLGTYTLSVSNSSLIMHTSTQNLYFGSKTIVAQSGPVLAEPAGVESRGRVEVLPVRRGAAGHNTGPGQVRHLLSGWDHGFGLRAEQVLYRRA